jgi:biotin-(acetyl-CoA carboxylase) ligase
VLGIGVNLEVSPQVDPTAFVPQVSSVWDFLSSEDPSLRADFLGNLLDSLARNYGTLLEEGGKGLLSRYRDRSCVVGEEVVICSESSDQTLHTVAQGRVLAIGENLELLLEGHPTPITGGRLILGDAAEAARNLTEGEGEGGSTPLVAKHVGL